MKILGISAFYHDSAAALLINGNIVAAAQEERFTRKKHDPRFPKNAIDYCLEEAKITPVQLNHVVFYDKPFLTFERLLLSYLTVAPKGVSILKCFLLCSLLMMSGNRIHISLPLNMPPLVEK